MKKIKKHVNKKSKLSHHLNSTAGAHYHIKRPFHMNKSGNRNLYRGGTKH